MGKLDFARLREGIALSMSRRNGVIVGLAALAVVMVGAGLWVISRGVSTEPAPRASDEASEVAEALELLESDPAALLPPELVAEFGDEVDSIFPGGTQVAADPATWERSSVGGGTIELKVTTPDGGSKTFDAVMARYDNGWKVLQAVELTGVP